MIWALLLEIDGIKKGSKPDWINKMQSKTLINLRLKEAPRGSVRVAAEPSRITLPKPLN
jgi:hypothetical protein